jgi:hypothetical protein
MFEKKGAMHLTFSIQMTIEKYWMSFSGYI